MTTSRRDRGRAQAATSSDSQDAQKGAGAAASSAATSSSGQSEASVEATMEITGEVFVISVAAELAGMHAQTLRTYDRLGLVTPRRTRGGGRRYSWEDVNLLRTIQHWSQEEGVNLAGIREILELTQQNTRLSRRIAELEAENEALAAENQRLSQRPVRGGELVHVPRSTAVVMWQPKRGRKSR